MIAKKRFIRLLPVFCTQILQNHIRRRETRSRIPIELTGKYLSAIRRSKTETAQRRFKSRRRVVVPLQVPCNQVLRRLLQQRTETSTACRQSYRNPVAHALDTRFPYQKTVREEQGTYTPGLTFAVSQPVVSRFSHHQTRRRLSVSARISEIQRLPARPTTALRFNNPFHVPVNLVRNENLFRLSAVSGTGRSDNSSFRSFTIIRFRRLLPLAWPPFQAGEIFGGLRPLQSPKLRCFNQIDKSLNLSIF